MKLRVNKQQLKKLLVVGIVGLFGLVAILTARGATSVFSFEAEQATLAGAATRVSDPLASGGSSVRFSEQAPGTVLYGPQTRGAPSTAYVTPEQYGASGNGTTDDTAEMTSAINAAAGKTLWLPAGKTYLISSPLSVGSNTTILGAGLTAKMKFNWVDQANGGALIRNKTNNDVNITLSNFVVQGASDGLPAGINSQQTTNGFPAVRPQGVDGLTITNMEVYNSSGMGISYHGVQNAKIQYNYVHNTGRDGITGYWKDFGNLTDILVDNNLVEKTGDDGIAINGLIPDVNNDTHPLPLRITITNNVYNGWVTDPNGKQAGRGFAMMGVGDVLIQNNKIDYPPSAGILLSGCNAHICNVGTVDRKSTARILNNQISNSGSGSRNGGIYIENATNSTITGNVITTSSPVFTNLGCTNCTIQSF